MIEGVVASVVILALIAAGRAVNWWYLNYDQSGRCPRKYLDGTVQKIQPRMVIDDWRVS